MARVREEAPASGAATSVRPSPRASSDKASRAAKMEHHGQRQDFFPCHRKLAGFDGLPIRDGQPGPRSEFLEGTAVLQAE